MVTKLTEAQYKAAKLLDDAANGNVEASIRLAEGISTSDLPVQLSPTLTKIALGSYAEQATIWREFAGKEVLPDFGKQEYYSFNGWGDEDVEDSTAGDTFLAGGLPTVPEYGEYARLRFEAAGQDLKLKKGGVAVQFSWELLRNTRNVGLIQRAFAEFGRRSAVKEDHEATKQLNTDNFKSANSNVATGTAAAVLTLDNGLATLQEAFYQITQQKFNGNAVTAGGNYRLVVSPKTALVARGLQSISQIEQVRGVGTANETRTIMGNPVGSMFSVVENPYFGALGIDEDSWFLIPAPGSTPNPSVLNLFLQGHETPQIFVKRTTASAPEDGSFENDDYETKVRHVATGAFLRPEGTLGHLV